MLRTTWMWSSARRIRSEPCFDSKASTAASAPKSCRLAQAVCVTSNWRGDMSPRVGRDRGVGVNVTAAPTRRLRPLEPNHAEDAFVERLLFLGVGDRRVPDPCKDQATVGGANHRGELDVARTGQVEDVATGEIGREGEQEAL